MTFDVIGIGTSPLMLMRAARLAALGERVLLCDRTQTLGGAWVTRSIMGMHNVEVGVHFLENRPTLTNALIEDLGLEVEAAGPDQCFGLYRGHRVGIPLTRVMLHSVVAAKAAARRQPDKAARIFLSACRALKNIRNTFYYPRGGAACITAALSERIIAHGGQIALGVEIRSIDIVGKRVRCVTSSGVLETRRALMGSRAFAPLTVGGVRVVADVERSWCYSAVIYLSGTEPGRFSYVEVLGDLHIRRARNVGAFAQPTPPANEMLVCVQYRQRFDGSDRELGRYLHAHLQRLGLVAPSAEVIAVWRSDLELVTLTNRSLARLSARSSGTVETLRTTDFAEGFVSCVQEDYARQPIKTRAAA